MFAPLYFRLVNDWCSGILSSVSKRMIWKPDIVVAAAKKVTRAPLLEGNLEQVRVSHGQMVWLTQADYRITCSMDFEDFPFDNQLCGFWLTGISGTQDTMNFVPDFELLTKSMTVRTLQFDADFSPNNEPLLYMNRTVVGFNIHLRRKIYPYIWNIYVPTLWIVIIASFSFLIPVACVPGTCLLI